MFESGAPPYNATREAVATMHRATAELKSSGIENAALKVGDRAQDFSLINHRNHEHFTFELKSPALGSTVRRCQRDD